MTNHPDSVPGDHPRRWDAAYVLGALTPAESLEYEAYLDEHPAARDDVADLARLPGLLRSISVDEAVALLDDEPTRDVAAGTCTVQALAARVSARRRRRRVGASLVAAAAVVALVVGGYTLGGLTAGASGSSQPSAAMTPAAGSQVTADIALASTKWGSRLDWECSYATAWKGGSGSYDLLVTDDSGAQTVVASWQAIGGKATGLTAATAIPAASIRAVSITVTGSTVPLATRHFE